MGGGEEGAEKKEMTPILSCQAGIRKGERKRCDCRAECVCACGNMFESVTE